MKFDCVIMNPPYSRNLHLKILAEAIKHLKNDESVCVNLSPIRWLRDPLAKYKKRNDYHKFENSISKHITDIETIDTNTVRSLFNVELSQPLGIYVCKKNNSNTVYINKYKVYPFIDRVLKKIIQDNNFEKHVKQTYNDNLENFVLINNMASPMKYGKPMFDALKTWCGYFQNGKNQNNLTYREAKAKNTRATRGSIDKDRAVVFKTPNEAKNCYNAMQTTFVKFFVMTSVVEVNVHQNVLPWMNDYTKPWTNERFYQFFNILPDEQKIIEDTMKKYIK